MILLQGKIYPHSFFYSSVICFHLLAAKKRGRGRPPKNKDAAPAPQRLKIKIGSPDPVKDLTKSGDAEWPKVAISKLTPEDIGK